MNSNLAAIEFQIASEIKVDAQGKATFSIRGVARLAGVSESALRQGFEGAQPKPTQLAESITGQGVEGAQPKPTQLAKFLTEQGVENADFLEFSKTGILDMTAALIVEYYAYETEERYRKVLAKQVHRAFARMGMRAYAHKLTKWEPHTNKVDDYKQALLEVLEVQLPAEPLPHKIRFYPRFWAGLEKVYGLKKGKRACGNFIKWRIYKYFPKEVCDRLQEINPLLEDGKTRQNLFHQHFDDKLLALLQERINQVTWLLEICDTRQEFKRKIAKINPITFNKGNVTFLKGGN